MARPWRIQFPGAAYHVMVRGNNRQDVFIDDADRWVLLELLGAAGDGYGLQVFAFCLMDNHFHVFLRTPEANLAETMHWINATYTIRFNRRHGRVGHLFQGRYKAVHVTSQSHWLRLSMYVHLNPVRAGIVGDPRDYDWSSFREYTGRGSRFPWLIVREVLLHYGGNQTSARRNYRRQCLALAAEDPEFWEGMRSSSVIGSREELEALAAEHPPSGDWRKVPAYVSAKRAAVNAEDELARVARACGVGVQDLLAPRRRFPPRQAAYYHLTKTMRLPAAQVAQLMGVTPVAVSNGAARFKRRIEVDEEASKILDQLCIM